MNNLWWKSEEELDPKQRGIFKIPIDRSHLILGPAGSGKTNLLLLRASQFVLSRKPNVLVLVLTRTLREFIAAGGSHYAFGAEKVQTLDNWRARFLYEHGVVPADHTEFEAKRLLQLEQVKSVVSKNKLAKLYDAIILDEAQDYRPEEIKLFALLGEVIFAAADSRQQIYVGGVDDSVMSGVFGENVYILKHHYRNGAKICALADELAKSWQAYEPMSPTSNYKESEYPSSVRIVESQSYSQQIQRLRESLILQMKTYPDEYLGVMCPSRSSLRKVAEALKQTDLWESIIFQSSESGYVEFSDQKQICLSTIHGAKGLEFRASHMIDCELIKTSPLNRNIAYTAVTRAKTSLHVYHVNNLPPYLDSALNVVRPAVPQAQLNQLFKNT